MADANERELRFRQLYRANFAPVQAYAVNRVALDEVPDIVAETFTITWRRLDDVPGPPQDKLWLYGTARRVISRHHRSSGRFRSLVDKVIASERAARRHPPGQDDPAQDRLLPALGSLRPAEREALLLVYWEELSYGEAAVVLGCSANAVGIRVHRAKASVRKALDSNAGSPVLSNMNGVTHGS